MTNLRLCKVAARLLMHVSYNEVCMFCIMFQFQVSVFGVTEKVMQYKESNHLSTKGSAFMF